MKLQIPEGWRAIGQNEIIEKGDKYDNQWDNQWEWFDCCSSIGGTIRKEFSDFPNTIVIRKIKQPMNTSNSETLTVSKQRVIEAANSCPDVRHVMEILFPDAFAKPITLFKVGDILNDSGNYFIVGHNYHGYYLYHLGNQVYDCGDMNNIDEKFKTLEDLSACFKHMKVISTIDKIKATLIQQ